MLKDWIQYLLTHITPKHLTNFLAAIVIFLFGVFLARKASQALMRFTHLDSQRRLLLSKASYYGLIALGVAAALNQMGFDIKVLLGAAGILTVAVGFAAQTSASNLISGLFLMFERPFVVGNVISVGDITGEVMSIDLLSSKIRTFNNLMVRIPNETLMKSNIINNSFFAIRRIELKVSVSLSADLAQVESILKRLANEHPLCLDEPQPLFIVSGFGESSMNIQFLVWASTPNVLAVQNEFYRDMRVAFGEAGVEIPYPTRTLISTAPLEPRTNKS